MASACGGNLLDAQAGIETNINRECYPSPNAAIYSMLKRALKRYDCSLGKCAVCGNLLDAQAGIETSRLRAKTKDSTFGGNLLDAQAGIETPWV